MGNPAKSFSSFLGWDLNLSMGYASLRSRLQQKILQWIHKETNPALDWDKTIFKKKLYLTHLIVINFIVLTHDFYQPFRPYLTTSRRLTCIHAKLFPTVKRRTCIHDLRYYQSPAGHAWETPDKQRSSPLVLWIILPNPFTQHLFLCPTSQERE